MTFITIVLTILKLLILSLNFLLEKIIFFIIVPHKKVTKL